MTAAVPDFALRQLARPAMRAPAPRPRVSKQSHPTFAPEPQGDKIFVTLLSLNFMLLAFFIVLGAAASVDKSRARSVAENVRIAFAGNDEFEKIRTRQVTARQALQAGVSDAFAGVLPAVPRVYVDNSDRTDVDIPEATLATALNGPDGDTVYDNIAHLLQSAPVGFRYALMISGGDENAPTGKAAFEFAGNLVDRGVAPQDILVGASKNDTGHLHMSFLVFEGEVDDDGEPWSAGILAPAPRKDEPLPEAPTQDATPVPDQGAAQEAPAPDQTAPGQTPAVYQAPAVEGAPSDQPATQPEQQP